MSLIRRLFGHQPAPKDALRPLYAAIVGHARDPRWYETGVPDTLDGRFEILTALVAHVLLRLEAEEPARAASVLLTEIFIDDMDGQLRQTGVGDLMVGKHVGKMMAALGGRLGGYRDAGDAAGRASVIHRNIWGSDGDAGTQAAASHAGVVLDQFARALDAQSTDAILAGQLPALAPS